MDIVHVGIKAWVPGSNVFECPEPTEVVSVKDGQAVVRYLSGIKKKDGEVAVEDLKIMDGISAGEGTPNMLTLDDLHLGAILYNLSKRYQNEIIYTYVGSILVAINPMRPLPLYTPMHVASYKQQMLGSLPPHLFAIADSAYYNMVESGRDQSILISGESGAGKTESTKLILQFLTHSSQDRSWIEQQIVDASPILEAFGNAQTNKNDNSSRFGKFIILQFDENHRVSGARIDPYLLETTRVVRQAAGERNYHIFYHLLGGATESQRAAWGLVLREGNQYLSSEPVDNDQKEFAEVMRALRVLGFTAEEQDGVFRTVSLVLALGALTFHPARTGNSESVIAQPAEVLEDLSSLSGISGAQFSSLVTTRSMTTAGEKYSIPLGVDKANSARDALARAIYGRLFDWLVNRINTAVCQEQHAVANFIGILDIFGFEDFEVNSFEQFCINYANEKLQQHFQQHVFLMEQEAYEADGIEWKRIDYRSNDHCVQLIDGSGKVGGIIAFLNEECNVPGGTPENFIENLAKFHVGERANQFFKKDKRSQICFAIEHYAGQVTYNGSEFLSKNKETSIDEAIDKFVEGGNEFLKGLFSMASNALLTSSNAGPSGTLHAVTVGTQFKKQLGTLMKTLQLTYPYYVRCVKPNATKSPLHFDDNAVAMQLNRSGMLDVVRIRKLGYPIRWTHDAFLKRYGFVTPNVHAEDKAAHCKAMFEALAMDAGEWQIGRDRVFIRSQTDYEMERLRGAKLNGYATRIQALYRGWSGRMRSQQSKWAAVMIQKVWRGHVDRIAVRELREEKARQGALVAAELAQEEEVRRQKEQEEAARLRQEEIARLKEAEEAKRQTDDVAAAQKKKEAAAVEEQQARAAVAEEQAGGATVEAAEEEEEERARLEAARKLAEETALAEAEEQRRTKEKERRTKEKEEAADLRRIEDTVRKIRKGTMKKGDFVNAKEIRRLQVLQDIYPHTTIERAMSADAANSSFSMEYVVARASAERSAKTAKANIKRSTTQRPFSVRYMSGVTSSMTSQASLGRGSANMTFSPDRLPGPLIAGDPEEAHTLFKHIIRYMGDRPAKLPLEQHAWFVAYQGHSNPAFRDEVYAQICNQLCDNPNAASEMRGWMLMAVCAATFLPSDAFLPYLYVFVVEKGASSASEQWADYARKQLLAAWKTMPRMHCPSEVEILAIQRMHPLEVLVSVEVSSLHGRPLSVPVEAHSTVHSLCASVAMRLCQSERHAKHLTSMLLISFVVGNTSTLLNDHEKIMDVIYKHEVGQTPSSWTFSCRPGVLFDIDEVLPIPDVADLIYSAARASVHDGRFMCEVEDALEIAYLEAVVLANEKAGGAGTQNKKTSARVHETIFRKVATRLGVHAKDYEHRLAPLTGNATNETRSAHDLKVEYVRRVSGLPLFGATSFLATAENGARTLLLIDSEGISLSDVPPQYKQRRTGGSLASGAVNRYLEKFDKHGWLSTKAWGWSKRYFALSEHVLYMYKTEKDFLRQRPAQEYLLNEAESVEGDPGNKKKYVFNLQIGAEKLVLHAESGEEMMRWLEALQRAVLDVLHAGKPKIKERMRPMSMSTWGIVVGKRALEIVQEENPDNKLCADCRAPDPTWASCMFGVCVCIQCSGAHRAFDPTGVAVRSLTLGEWEPSALDILMKIGNRRANDLLEGAGVPEKDRPALWSSMGEREAFVHEKYVTKKYMKRVPTDGGDVAVLEAVQSGVLPAVLFALAQSEDGWAAAHGSPALHAAVSMDSPAMVDLLCHNGAEVSKANDKGLAPLDVALSSANSKCVEVLSRHGAQKERRRPGQGRRRSWVHGVDDVGTVTSYAFRDVLSWTCASTSVRVQTREVKSDLHAVTRTYVLLCGDAKAADALFSLFNERASSESGRARAIEGFDAAPSLGLLSLRLAAPVVVHKNIDSTGWSEGECGGRTGWFPTRKVHFMSQDANEASVIDATKVLSSRIKGRRDDDSKDKVEAAGSLVDRCTGNFFYQTTAPGGAVTKSARQHCPEVASAALGDLMAYLNTDEADTGGALRLARKIVERGATAEHSAARLEILCQVAMQMTRKPAEKERTPPESVKIFGGTVGGIMAFQRKDADPEVAALTVPRIVRESLDTVRRLDGVRTQGIFRVPATATDVKMMKDLVEQGDYALFADDEQDVNTPAAVLKLWLRELAEPFVPDALYERCVACGELEDDAGLAEARAILALLPEECREIVKALCELFADVIANVELSRMPLSNIAMVFTPSFLRNPSTDPIVLMANTKKETRFVEGVLQVALEDLDSESAAAAPSDALVLPGSTGAPPVGIVKKCAPLLLACLSFFSPPAKAEEPLVAHVTREMAAQAELGSQHKPFVDACRRLVRRRPIRAHYNLSEFEWEGILTSAGKNQLQILVPVGERHDHAQQEESQRATLRGADLVPYLVDVDAASSVKDVVVCVSRRLNILTPAAFGLVLASKGQGKPLGSSTCVLDAISTLERQHGLAGGATLTFKRIFFENPAMKTAQSAGGGRRAAIDLGGAMDMMGSVKPDPKGAEVAFFQMLDDVARGVYAHSLVSATPQAPTEKVIASLMAMHACSLDGTSDWFEDSDMLLSRVLPPYLANHCARDVWAKEVNDAVARVKVEAIGITARSAKKGDDKEQPFRVVVMEAAGLPSKADRVMVVVTHGAKEVFKTDASQKDKHGSVQWNLASGRVKVSPDEQIRSLTANEKEEKAVLFSLYDKRSKMRSNVCIGQATLADFTDGEHWLDVCSGHVPISRLKIKVTCLAETRGGEEADVEAFKALYVSTLLSAVPWSGATFIPIEHANDASMPASLMMAINFRGIFILTREGGLLREIAHESVMAVQNEPPTAGKLPILSIRFGDLLESQSFVCETAQAEDVPSVIDVHRGRARSVDNGGGGGKSRVVI